MVLSKHDVWCVSCGCIMKKRRGKFGEFFGCTGYPVCRNTMNLRDAAIEPEQPRGTRPDSDDISIGPDIQNESEEWFDK